MQSSQVVVKKIDLGISFTHTCWRAWHHRSITCFCLKLPINIYQPKMGLFPFPSVSIISIPKSTSIATLQVARVIWIGNQRRHEFVGDLVDILNHCQMSNVLERSSCFNVSHEGGCPKHLATQLLSGSFDRGSLGLSRQWAGQTPAEAAARERQQRAEKVTQEGCFFLNVSLRPKSSIFSGGCIYACHHLQPFLVSMDRFWDPNVVDMVATSSLGKNTKAMKRMAIEGLFSKLCKQGLIRHQPLKPTEIGSIASCLCVCFFNVRVTPSGTWMVIWIDMVRLNVLEANWPLWWVDLPKCFDQILWNTFCPVWVLGTKSFCKGAHFFPVELHHFNYRSESTPLTQYLNESS